MVWTANEVSYTITFDALPCTEYRLVLCTLQETKQDETKERVHSIG